MWINERLNASPESELPHIGRVVRLQGGFADVEGDMKLAEVACISPFGMACLPPVGEEVLVVPGASGYYCIGSSAGAPAAGAVTLRNAAGAEILLREDGSISLNGVVISKDGVIIAPNSSQA